MDFAHSGDGVSTTITGLTADTECQVQVRAKNGEVDSDWSDPSDAVRTHAETPPPDAPLGVRGVERACVPYPSPASQEIRLADLPDDRTYSYRIYTLAGRPARAGALRGRSISLGGLSAGQYVLVLREKDGSGTLRARLAVK